MYKVIFFCIRWDVVSRDDLKFELSGMEMNDKKKEV